MVCIKSVVLFAAACIHLDMDTIVDAAFPKEVQEQMDQNVNPCDDFYRYACGSFIAKADLTVNNNNTSEEVSVTMETNDANQMKMIEMMEADEIPQASTLFHSCMDFDTEHAELNIEPFRQDLERIRTIESTEELFALAGQLMNPLQIEDHAILFPSLEVRKIDGRTKKLMFGFSSPDQKRTVLADSDSDSDSDGDQNQDEAQVQDPTAKIQTILMSVAGLDEAEAAARAQDIMSVQSRLKKMKADDGNEMQAPTNESTSTRRRLQNVHQQYKYSDYKEAFPHLVGALTSALGMDIQNDTATFLYEPEAFVQAEILVQETPLSALQSVLMFDYLMKYRDFLMAQKGDQESRQQYCLHVVLDLLPHTVGKFFGMKTLDTEGKKLIEEMLQLMMKTMQRRIEAAEWLDEQTKAAAQKKLSMMHGHVGYSETIEELPEDLNVTSLFNNVRAVYRYQLLHDLENLDQPVDRDEWMKDSTEYNAYFQQNFNGMFINAGYLPFPRFSASYDPAINFGASGFMIGHELTHGFDNKGRTRDEFGTIQQWWSNDSDAEFQKRATCVKDQYDNFAIQSSNASASDSVLGHVNGSLTLGENIADLGGVSIAYDAMKTFLENMNRELTQELEQLYFLSFAQGFCSKRTDDLAKERLSDVHSPAEFRVNGVLMNNRDFGRVFQCPSGTYMNPETKCQLW